MSDQVYAAGWTIRDGRVIGTPPAKVTRQTLVQQFEQQSGRQYDPDGPSPRECEHCGELYQYIPEKKKKIRL